MSDSRKPVNVVRIGRISCAIWRNTTTTGET